MHVPADSAATEVGTGHDGRSHTGRLTLRVVRLAHDLIDRGPACPSLSVRRLGRECAARPVEMSVDALLVASDLVHATENEQLFGKRCERFQNSLEALSLERGRNSQPEENVEGSNRNLAGNCRSLHFLEQRKPHDNAARSTQCGPSGHSGAGHRCGGSYQPSTPGRIGSRPASIRQRLDGTASTPCDNLGGQGSSERSAPGSISRGAADVKTHLPAESAQESKEARFPHPDEDTGRQTRARSSPGQGPEATLRQRRVGSRRRRRTAWGSLPSGGSESALIFRQSMMKGFGSEPDCSRSSAERQDPSCPDG